VTDNQILRLKHPILNQNQLFLSFCDIQAHIVFLHGHFYNGCHLCIYIGRSTSKHDKPSMPLLNREDNKLLISDEDKQVCVHPKLDPFGGISFKVIT
jgi:hypothetical protein